MSDDSKKIFIDIEPTWEQLLNWVKDDILDVEELRPACVIADMIRQSQKRGDKYIKFEFTKDGIDVETSKEDNDEH